jgi:hypothetical protein
MTLKLFHKLICLVKGHTTDRTPLILFRSWDSLHEIGSLHCRRCGAMLSEYNKNLAEPVR